jgi:hypothetical protein
MHRLPGLTYANVVATLALIIAVGGASAFAATQLKKNSVGTKQLKKGAVTAAKVKKGTLTGKQINLQKLGTVPNAAHASSADTIPPAEPTHVVGAAGEPGFLDGSSSYGEVAPGVSLPRVGFFKEQFGIVHLEGVAKLPSAPSQIFTLPPGYRPAVGQSLVFSSGEKGAVQIIGFEESSVERGAVLGSEVVINLSGITFRAQS